MAKDLFIKSLKTLRMLGKTIHLMLWDILFQCFLLTVLMITISFDDAERIIICFLKEAKTFRGEKARELKQELKDLLKEK